MTQTPLHPKRILSIDGGGLRGVAAIAFLEALEARLAREAGQPVALHEHFDLIGGTSTGAIIAASLALGHSLAEIKDHYFRLAPNVFRRAWNRVPLVHPLFSARALEREFVAIAGNATLGSPELKTGLAIVLKRIDTGSVWIVSNNPAGRFFDDCPDGSFIGNRHYNLAELIRASTAAPHYFDPEEIAIGPEQNGLFVDGSVSPFNNPSWLLFQMVALPAYAYHWQTGADALEITSIGTGTYRYRIGHEGWTRRLSSLLAINALQAVISDCDMHTLTLMQALGKNETPWRINSEIGDMTDALIAGAPLFVFRRYDLPLEADALAAMGAQVSPRDLAQLRDITNLGAMRRVYDLAQMAAQLQVG